MVWIRFSIQRVLRTVDGRGEERRGEHLLQRDTACIRDRVSRRHERPTTTTTDAHVPMIYSQFAFLMNNKPRMQVSFSSNRETKGCLVAYRFDGQNVARPSSIKESKISPSIRNLLKRERAKKERHFSTIKTRENRKRKKATIGDNAV